MRIPYKIDENTFKVYDPSPESLALIHENERQLQSENFAWDKDHCPSLATLCVDVIQKKFEKEPLLDELPCTDRDYLLETLRTDLALELVVPLIDQEIYWKRRYKETFGSIQRRKPQSWTWKRLYIEKHMEDLIEKAEPQYNDEDDMAEITKICAPYIKRLLISQLQHWRPPSYWDEEDIPEIHPIDHIDFDPIFKKLVNIEEFGVIFGMNRVSDHFTWHMFKLSVLDCQRLGKAVHHLKSLKILRVHRSKLEDQHIRALMQGLIKNEVIEELDLSHCEIGDIGALCIAKVLCVHPALKILNLCNNRIKCLGAEGIGFALLEEGCLLTKLDISLNPLGDGGTMGILRALVRGTHLEELSMASCEMEDDAIVRVGQMLKLNTSLKRLDVTNNWFDEEGGKVLVHGMEVNRTLLWLDIRETDISLEQSRFIKKCLARNKLGLDSVDDIVEVTEQAQEVEAVEVAEEKAVEEKVEEKSTKTEI